MYNDSEFNANVWDPSLHSVMDYLKTKSLRSRLGAALNHFLSLLHPEKVKRA